MKNLILYMAILLGLPSICLGNGREILDIERGGKRYGGLITVVIKTTEEKFIIPALLVNLFDPAKKTLTEEHERELRSCLVKSNSLDNGYYLHEILTGRSIVRLPFRVSLASSAGPATVHSMRAEDSTNSAVVSDPITDQFIEVALERVEQDELKTYISKLENIDTFPANKIERIRAGIGHAGGDSIHFYIVDPNDPDKCLEVWLVDQLFTRTL